MHFIHEAFTALGPLNLPFHFYSAMVNNPTSYFRREARTKRRKKTAKWTRGSNCSRNGASSASCPRPTQSCRASPERNRETSTNSAKRIESPYVCTMGLQQQILVLYLVEHTRGTVLRRLSTASAQLPEKNTRIFVLKMIELRDTQN